MIILGIETSCDDTCVAVYDSKNGILSESFCSQINNNKKYGGIVPELASYNHVLKLCSLILLTLKKKKLSLKNLDAIAYTKGPGLISPLFIGNAFGKALAYSLNIPVIGVNHLEAHLLIALKIKKKIHFPCLGIIVSGGHTLFIKMINYHKYMFLGGTLDDGAGEVFDKVSRFMKAEYPSGLFIENMSENINEFYCCNFPIPLYKSSCYNLSFSGLKTSVKNKLNKKHQNINNIAYNFQNVLIKSISNKCKKILINTKIKTLILSGGVCVNKQLRREIINTAMSYNVSLYKAPLKYCMDNGSMIALAGYIKIRDNFYDKDMFIQPYAKYNFHF